MKKAVRILIITGILLLLPFAFKACGDHLVDGRSQSDQTSIVSTLQKMDVDTNVIRYVQTQFSLTRPMS